MKFKFNWVSYILVWQPLPRTDSPQSLLSTLQFSLFPFLFSPFLSQSVPGVLSASSFSSPPPPSSFVCSPLSTVSHFCGICVWVTRGCADICVIYHLISSFKSCIGSTLCRLSDKIVFTWCNLQTIFFPVGHELSTEKKGLPLQL